MCRNRRSHRGALICRLEINDDSSSDKAFIKRREYDRLLAELASEFHGAPSAIQNQINFSTTTQKSFNNRSHVANFILNNAAALETGFISTSELPNQLISN
jgi:hypothetical protein